MSIVDEKRLYALRHCFFHKIIEFYTKNQNFLDFLFLPGLQVQSETQTNLTRQSDKNNNELFRNITVQIWTVSSPSSEPLSAIYGFLHVYPDLWLVPFPNKFKIYLSHLLQTSTPTGRRWSFPQCPLFYPGYHGIFPRIWRRTGKCRAREFP